MGQYYQQKLKKVLLKFVYNLFFNIFEVLNNKTIEIMKIYLLKNGNTLKIENDYCWADVDSTKITFDIVHIQKDGYWNGRETVTINLSYYSSINDYIETNHKTI